jgi:hypothetical protein
MKIIYLLFSLLSFLQVAAQETRKIIPSAYQLDSLKQSYGKNKNLVPGYELQSLVALSFYPELYDTRIDFKIANKESIAKTTLPFTALIFNCKHYIIYLNNNRSRTGIVFSEIPFNAQVGVIGHELAHAVDFKHKNLPGFAWWGLRYLNKKTHVKIERATDLETIRHGLGWQLYDFTNFIMRSPATKNEYKKSKQKFYLHPDEIMQILNSRNY